MDRYLGRIVEVVKKETERPLFFDGDESITYGGAWEESGKIYRYLKSKGIGREDFVQIIAKKDIHFFSCMLGVWRAGAALVINEDSYPKERLDFIGRDLQAKLVLDNPLFETIMASQEPLDGYEETDPHDACYAVYTSGSTGNPKGVLHEYGNLDQSFASFFPEAENYTHYKNGFVPPLNFVAAILEAVVSTACAMTNFLVSGALLRDYNSLTAFIKEKELDRIYLPPSYIRLYKTPTSSLKVVQTGSEPANGLYYEGGVPKIVNTYSMSESGFCVLSAVLDKAYDVAPVGFPCLTIDYTLLDDDGRVIEGAGQGELCFKNEYVRGYINLPEQTKKAFVDGMYHTADICRRDESGAYYVVGRNDDMIKINGNRIEPAEIEAAVQRSTGLEKVVAKGFSEKTRSFIAVYYLAEDAAVHPVSPERVTEDLKGTLPSYMLPTYYIPLTAFPLNPNGKLSRKDLPKPDEEPSQREYAEPSNEAERYFCEKMQEVLEVDRVGAEDDFYLIGGDSISAIRLVEQCREYDISVRQIYEHKTPRELAKHCVKAAETGAMEIAPETYGKLSLLPTQKQFLYYQEYAPDSAFLNMAAFWRLKKEVNTGKLLEAVEKLIAYHPEICMKLTKEPEDQVFQQYEKSYGENPVKEINASEDELEKAIHGFNKPLPLFDSRLYRGTLVHCGEEHYFGFLIHHILADGESFAMLLSDLYALCTDESFVPPKDRYFGIVKDLQEAKKEESFREAERYFASAIKEIRERKSIGLKKDWESEKRTSAILSDPECFARGELYDTNFFLTAVMVATAWYNKSDYAYTYVTYDGRHNRETLTAPGFLITQLVLGVEIKPDSKPGELLAPVKGQMQFSMNHLEYNYMEEKIGDGSDMVRFTYQKDTLYAGYKMDILAEESIKVSDTTIMPGILGVNIVDNQGTEKLGLTIRYCPDIYKKESIKKYRELIKKAVRFLGGANE